MYQVWHTKLCLPASSSLLLLVHVPPFHGCHRQLLTDAEVYMVQNPYIVPDQRVFHLLQYVGNKGPKAPTKLLQCLVEEPLHQGHMYLAARLLGETKKGNSIWHPLYNCCTANACVNANTVNVVI